MKVTVARGVLLPALAQAARVAASSATIPILAHILLRTDAGGLTITASDLEITIAIALEAEVDEPGDCALPAKLLHDYVRRLPEGVEIVIACDQGAARASVKAGRLRSQPPALLGADFPDVPEVKAAATFSIDAGEFARLFTVTAPAVSTDEARYYLRGHYLHAREVAGADPELRAVATNGHILAKAATPAPAGALGMPGVIVPQKIAEEIRKLAEAHKAEFRVSVSEARLEIVAGGARLSSKVIDGTFPEYERIIPSAPGRVALVDADALVAAIGRVALFTSRGSDRHGTANLAFTDDGLRVWAKSAEAGEAEEPLEVEFEGDDFAIAFADDYLTALVRAAKADTVQLEMSHPLAAMLIRAKEGAPDLFLIMPKRGD